jgi:hypothetical protein
MRKDRLLQMAERGRFLATLNTDPEEAYEGILIDWDDAHYIFGDAFQVAANGDRLRIDSEFWLPRENVKYMQRLQHRNT